MACQLVTGCGGSSALLSAQCHEMAPGCFCLASFVGFSFDLPGLCCSAASLGLLPSWCLFTLLSLLWWQLLASCLIPLPTSLGFCGVLISGSDNCQPASQPRGGLVQGAGKGAKCFGHSSAGHTSVCTLFSTEGDVPDKAIIGDCATQIVIYSEASCLPVLSGDHSCDFTACAAELQHPATVIFALQRLPLSDDIEAFK